MQIIEWRIAFSTLPRVFTSDVEHIAANEVTIWRVSELMHISIDAVEALLHVASISSIISTITCVAVDERGHYCAVGTSTSTIAVWILEKECPRTTCLYRQFLSISILNLFRS